MVDKVLSPDRETIEVTKKTNVGKMGEDDREDVASSKAESEAGGENGSVKVTV